MIVRSRAPLRLSFCGGGTDVPPYPEERGGVVLSTTINKYAFASLVPQAGADLKVTSLDYDTIAKYHLEDGLVYDGELDLVKAAVHRLNPERQGLDLFIHTDAPPGSGLGSSSAMAVALVGAFQRWRRLPVMAYDVAELAYRIERVDLGIKGGMQDQYAATFGGFNFIEFRGDDVIVNPLRIEPSLLDELEYRLLLCYTGKTRLSAHILDRQINAYVGKHGEVVRALDAMKDLAIQMKNALLLGRLDAFGELLDVAWGHKKKLDAQISNDQIDELYELARKNGALGGKILGAGGGGYLLLYCQFDRKHKVAEALERIGGQVVDFGFDLRGLQTWEVNGR
ncbi:MAG: GHMP kinase [Bacteroidetes bacterium]|nr:GHMP kinase [Bacteroidota bacterium]MCL5026214.1 GHMP kinase [Chloroflexota bacterium]